MTDTAVATHDSGEVKNSLESNNGDSTSPKKRIRLVQDDDDKESEQMNAYSTENEENPDEDDDSEEPEEHNINNPRRGPKQWQKDELDKLVQLKEEGLTWKEIAAEIEGRSAKACQNRYSEMFKHRGDTDATPKTIAPKQQSMESGRNKYWTPEEDKQLLDLVEQKLSWAEIGERIVGRNRGQCEGRYRRIRQTASDTVDDDESISNIPPPSASTLVKARRSPDGSVSIFDSESPASTLARLLETKPSTDDLKQAVDLHLKATKARLKALEWEMKLTNRPETADAVEKVQLTVSSWESMLDWIVAEEQRATGISHDEPRKKTSGLVH